MDMWNVIRWVLSLLLGWRRSFTRQSLNAFAQLHGVSQYDETQANRLQGCFRRYSTPSFDLQQASDAAWESFARLGVEGADNWGKDGPYEEYDPTPLPSIGSQIPGTIVVAEPCNAVSNIAYYRAAVELCTAGIYGSATDRAIFLAMSTLAFGSTFYHTGITEAGLQADTKPIAVTTLIFHQNAVSSLPYSSELYEFSDSPWPELAVAAAETVARILSEKSGDVWTAELGALDFPRYDVTFSGFVIVAFNLIFDEDTATSIVRTMGGILLTRPATSAFIFNEFLPTVSSSLAGIQVPLLARVDLLLKVMGGALKMMYAFLWQEQIIDADVINSNSAGNAAGTFLYVALNRYANSLTRNERELSIQMASNIYPGDVQCRLSHAHSKWHEFSANALVDMYFLSKDVDRVLRGGMPSNIIRLEDVPRLFPGCQVLEGGNRTDNEKMANLADCFISSTPAFSCLRDCSQDPNTIASCATQCPLTSLF